MEKTPWGKTEKSGHERFNSGEGCAEDQDPGMLWRVSTVVPLPGLAEETSPSLGDPLTLPSFFP